MRITTHSPTPTSVSPTATTTGTGSWPAWLLASLLLFTVPTLFSGGCYWHDCDDDDAHHDDDDHGYCDDDDDHGHAVTLAPPAAKQDPYRLIGFEVRGSDVANAHPIAALVGIEGVNLFHSEGPESYERADFEMFTSLVILVNKQLIGLPESAGILAFEDVRFHDEGIDVRYRQEVQQGDGSYAPVTDSELLFRFDLLGNLFEIRNRTWLEPPR